MVVNLGFLENPQEMEIVVSGPGETNRLFIYTGTAVFSFKGIAEGWRRDQLTFEIGRSFTSSQFIKAIATASLASISNAHHAVNAGWAVDRVEADQASSGRVMVTLNLAVNDIDGFLHRIAYEVSVKAKL